MPTFTTIQLETLLESRTRTSNPKQQQQQQLIQHENHDSVNNIKLDQDEDELKKKKKETKIAKRRSPNHVFISPTLYTTPQPTPILDSHTSLSGSVSPSPYVFNRKGRGGGGGAVGARLPSPSLSRRVEQEVEELKKKTTTACDSDEIGGGVVDDNFVDGGADEKCDVDEDFFDPRADSASSVADSIDLNDFERNVDSLSLVSNQGDFFDADEEFFSDGSVSSVRTCGRRSIESELRATRLSLFEEIEKRKTAEDVLAMIQGLWQRVSNLLLYQTGLKFPIPSHNTDIQLELSSFEQFSQEVIVARFVAEAIGKAEGRAEAELAAEVIIESKDQEISRLKDRLQYYEAMNHEMSQRNIEVMEVARRQRIRKRVQHKWLWSCVGISVVIGASVIAYSCLPHTTEHQLLLDSSNETDSSSISSSESS